MSYLLYMRLGKFGKIFHLDNVKLGKGSIRRFTLFEFKFIGAVILNIFNSIEQDRFHTHAFEAFSFMFYGNYIEEMSSSDGKISSRKRSYDLVYLPRNLNHRILVSSKNALSLTICGPWEKTWTETFLDGKIRKFTWGRKRL